MILTPKVCRAGRALLAWTQRDLADRAQTAVSTVADFERGARVPIPNSIEALTNALEAGGARFDGGQATLLSSSPGFTALPGGRPIRWLDAADLCEWANRRDGQSGLPQLIDMLVLASAGADAQRHFPAGESVQRGGWDGTCQSPRAIDYVPAGFSGWELTVQRENIAKKAQDDFDKRADAGDSASRAATTFVFAVMRSWPGKDAWAAKQRDRGIFADVRALDVDDLVHWLNAYPVVQQWVAEKIGKHPRSGVVSLLEMWQRWSLVTKPPLSERIALAGRDKEATQVHAWLKGPPSVLSVQAATSEEAVAFLWAAISEMPEDVRLAYLTHTLYAQSDDAVRELSVAMKSLIVVMNGESAGFGQSVVLKGHHVYAVLDPAVPRNNGIALGRVRRVDLADALESIGADRGEAHSLAVRSGGSVAALRRIMADETMPLPRWVEGTSPDVLRALLLAGAWDENSEGDQATVAALAHRPYDEIAHDVEPLTIGVDSAVRRSGTKLRLISRQDAWFLLAPRLTKADIDQFFELARDVLREIDPQFAQRGRSRLLALDEQRTTYSRELRRGIVEALSIMATFPDRAAEQLFIQERVGGVVRGLFEGGDAALWWSLRDNLPGVAEAAPQDFLDAVEASLARADAPVTALLQGDGEGVFARDYVSDLTSALERLAWSADYFAGSVSALAGLAAKDATDSRNGNRPASTLRKIFLPWNPQTFVSLDDRLAVLDGLRHDYPGVAWKLMVSLLPRNYDTSSYSSEPVWRRTIDEEAEPVTPLLLQKSADEIFIRLLKDAGGEVARWNEVF